MNNLVLVFALIGVLGVGAQWIAWRFNLPAIVVMAIAGLVAGPVTGLLWPEGYDPASAAAAPMQTLFGDFYRPIIGVAVAVILFEGGLTLNFAEIRGITAGVRRLVFPGAFVAWGLGAAAGHFVGGLTWDVAILFAGVMVVTGPTVIAPLLRQSKLAARPAALLKWEGIVNDPLGALLAVLAYEVAVLDFGGAHGGTPVQIVASLALAAVLDGLFGFLMGRAVAAVFRRGWTPEYLKPPILLVAVLVCFEVANLLQEEGGLVAVTVMGVTLANSKIASINELRHFKENVAVLLVSGVFIILTANLTWGTFAALDARAYLFLAAMLFIVRPASVFLSTIGAGLPWRERALVGWIAPRGIVAVAVTSFFGAALASGLAGSLEAASDPGSRAALSASLDSAQKMIPLAFAMVFATVVLHGFTIGPLAKALGLASTERPGVLISGASLWSAALAQKLQEADVPVLVADASWRRLRPVRQAGAPTYYGELLSEVTEHHLDLNRFGALLAVSGNEAHNALVCTDLAPELGRASIYQINARGKDEDDKRALSYTLQGLTLLHSAAPLDELLRRHFAGWTFQKTRITDAYPPEQYAQDLAEGGEIVAIIRKGAVLIASAEKPIKPATGDLVIAYAPKAEPVPKPSEEERSGDPRSAAKVG
ncbi:MAG: sodium:proton antiporter [Pseudomonadota bacterium]